MRKSTDKRFDALAIDMKFFYKWFYGCTIVALILALLFNYEMYYVGLAIVFGASGRKIQQFSDKLHEIRFKDQDPYNEEL